MSFTPSRAWMDAARPAVLTFDDGPLSLTSLMIMDVLARYDITAIFFVVGAHIEQDDGRDVLDRMVTAGHTIGNHSYAHARLSRLTVDEIVQDLTRAQALIERAGVHGRLFRPPYGVANERVAEAARSLGFTGLGWTADTEDWQPALQPVAWIDHGIAAVQDHRADVVLMHDRKTTAEGLGTFIERLMAIGYTFPPLFDDTASDDQQHTSSDHQQHDAMWTPGPAPGWETLRTLPLLRPTHDLTETTR